MNGKIIVVTHKEYDMPEDSIYFPICVGVGIPKLSHKFQPDNTGINISDKNCTYCELTAIFWAWKNLPPEVEYIGVTHYRRHFSIDKRAATLDHVVSGKQLEDLFAKYGDDTIITTPFRHYFESIEDHYIHSLKGYEEIHKKDIMRLKAAIHKCTPEYDETTKKVLTGNTAHMLNMFIMRRDIYNNYCNWPFPIIDTVVEMSNDREDQKRYAGALSEFCLDIWVRTNNMTIKELYLLETEKTSCLKKAIEYIKRKI